jgi:hypothetical protein
MVEQPSEAMPEDVRQAFCDAVRLFDHWRFDEPAPALSFRILSVSLSGVCDLVLAYKNEPLPVGVYDELWRLIDGPHISLKAELAIDPSYATGARCLDKLIKDRRAAIEASLPLSKQDH